MEDKYEIENCAVAFIDILGCRDMMRKDSEESLNRVHRIYVGACEGYKKFANSQSLCMPDIKIFSDNIVLSINEDIHGEFALSNLILAAAVFQLKFLEEGILVRGGITKGDFFSDKIMLWGNALARAYQLESELAIYPRIIVDPKYALEFKILPAIKNRKLIKEDIDGIHLINYLNLIYSLNAEECRKLIEESNVLLVGLNNNDSKNQKLGWHKNYTSTYLCN